MARKLVHEEVVCLVVDLLNVDACHARDLVLSFFAFQLAKLSLRFQEEGRQFVDQKSHLLIFFLRSLLSYGLLAGGISAKGGDRSHIL